jgi:hypothetical protein
LGLVKGSVRPGGRKRVRFAFDIVGKTSRRREALPSQCPGANGSYTFSRYRELTLKRPWVPVVDLAKDPGV